MKSNSSTTTTSGETFHSRSEARRAHALRGQEPPVFTEESPLARRGLRITLACGAKFLYTLKGWPRSTYYCPKCGKTCRTKDFVEVGDPESMHAMKRVLEGGKRAD